MKTALTVEDRFDLEGEDIVALYDCLSDKLAAGYAKEGDAVGANFRSWAPTATRPAIQGSHGTRILNTFANEIAAEQYLKFEDEGVNMPVGSVLAKESISLSIKKKKARPGPLFIIDQNGSRFDPRNKRLALRWPTAKRQSHENQTVFLP